MREFNPALLEILGCPREMERPPLQLHGNLLICTVCGYGYRIDDGIPNLLIEAALTPDQVQQEKDGRN